MIESRADHESGEQQLEADAIGEPHLEAEANGEPAVKRMPQSGPGAAAGGGGKRGASR